MNKEKEIKEKQEMFKSGTNYNAVIENKKFNRSRPSSAYSNRKNYSIFKNSSAQALQKIEFHYILILIILIQV